MPVDLHKAQKSPNTATAVDSRASNPSDKNPVPTSLRQQHLSANPPGEITWQQTKSQLTRNAVLQAAVDCLYELGYTKTTTEQITQRAQVSRGAMLHHFPNRLELIRATIDYILRLRIEIFATEEFAIQKGAEHSLVEEGIESYWQQLNTPAFMAFQELRVAARTDQELALIMEPAMQSFNSAWRAAVVDVFPDLALSDAFEHASYLTQLVLEGMVIAKHSVGFDPSSGVPAQHKMLNWLKQELRRTFDDVLTHAKRPRED